MILNLLVIYHLLPDVIPGKAKIGFPSGGTSYEPSLIYQRISFRYCVIKWLSKVLKHCSKLCIVLQSPQLLAKFVKELYFGGEGEIYCYEKYGWSRNDLIVPRAFGRHCGHNELTAYKNKAMGF